MRGALLVFKKEFMEFTKDRKTMFFTLVLPLLLMPSIFLMVNALGQSDERKRENSPSRVAVADPEGLVTPLLLADTKKFKIVPQPEGDPKQAIRDQKVDLMVKVEPGATAKAARQETYTVTALRDRSEGSSQEAYSRLKEALSLQDKSAVAVRLKSISAPPQLAVPTKLEAEEAGDSYLGLRKFMGSFLPYFVMIMMFQGSMNHGVYTTAGEKERGTLLSLLSTALPRNQIIWGKLLYVFTMGVTVSLLNLLSLGFTFGTMARGAASHADAAGAAAGLSAVASPATLLLTFLLMVPLGLMLANLILLMGIRAKNTVEGNTSLMPFMFLLIFLGMFIMAPGVDKLPVLPYLPVVNVCLAIRKLFSQQGNAAEYLVALFMTLGLAGLMTWFSTRFLNREEAIFRA